MAIAAAGLLGWSLLFEDSTSVWWHGGPPSPSATVAASGEGEYAFVYESPEGIPATWDPCTPIKVLINLDQAPDGTLTEVQGALDRIAAASEFRFEVVGTTTEIPQRNWAHDVGDSYEGWPPVLIAFAHEHETDILEGIQSAAGGGDRLVGPDGPTYVSGSIAVDVAQVPTYLRGFGPRSLGGLILHEMLHVLGLGHTDSRVDVMRPLISEGPGDIGPGDRAGLAALAAGGCRSTPPATPPSGSMNPPDGVADVDDR